MYLSNCSVEFLIPGMEIVLDSNSEFAFQLVFQLGLESLFKEATVKALQVRGMDILCEIIQ